MESWIRIFSEFTPEALFFEALGILLLCAAYSAYWVVAKRRVGVAYQAMPPGVVRGYLNQLIVDAEGLRSQLFGLLTDTGAGAARVPVGVSVSPASDKAAPADPDIAKRLQALEQKLAEQNLAMSSLMTDKAKLEAELAAAKTKQAAAGPAAAATDNGENDKLKKKIQELEERLAEYSVIEDDLANLKRMQQENSQLKAQLSLKAGGAALGAAAVVAAAAPEVAAAPAPAAPAPKLTETNSDGVAPEPSAQADAFEGLVDEVEKSLGAPASGASSQDVTAAIMQPQAPASEASEAAAPAAPPANEPAAGGETPTPLEGMGKGDEDLLAEFEKMLNS
ncbi:MAG: hypothetical protein IT285_08825 [Bdellovibrionales bacterium]|nr:hypothetical protein [Bdellovibrionales bacterium]